MCLAGYTGLRDSEVIFTASFKDITRTVSLIKYLQRRHNQHPRGYRAFNRRACNPQRTQRYYNSASYPDPPGGKSYIADSRESSPPPPTALARLSHHPYPIAETRILHCEASERKNASGGGAGGGGGFLIIFRNSESARTKYQAIETRVIFG